MVSKYRGWASVQLSPPMVWHNDALDAVFHGQLSILLGQDPLDDNRQTGDRLQPVHVLPADGRVQGVGRYPILLRDARLLLTVHVVHHSKFPLDIQMFSGLLLLLVLLLIIPELYFDTAVTWSLDVIYIYDLQAFHRSSILFLMHKYFKIWRTFLNYCQDMSSNFK